MLAVSNTRDRSKLKGREAMEGNDDANVWFVCCANKAVKACAGAITSGVDLLP